MGAEVASVARARALRSMDDWSVGYLFSKLNEWSGIESSTGKDWTEQQQQ